MKNILLIGLGRFGKHIAMQLNEMGHEIMAVDINEERVNRILPFVTNAQIGDSTDASFLESLGIGNFDICFVTIGGSFQNSLETTSLLKELGAKLVVSKWSSIRYADDHILDYMEVDASHAIFEVAIPDEWIGRSVGELDIRRRYNINILAVKKEREVSVTISVDTVLEADSTLLVLGDYKAIQKFFHI